MPKPRKPSLAARARRTTGFPAIDSVIVLAIGVFSAFLSGSQPWAGFNSPDSEFYASLALFGSEVTDRAIEPAYTWTRLGFIAPVRLLTQTLGPWAGFAVWRFLLILLIAAALFWLVRQAGGGRALATAMALIAALNTMVLSYVANPYLTGTIIAATLLFIALATWCASDTARVRWLPALLSGLVAGWLVMLNPYALLLGLAMWIAVRIVGLTGATPDHHRMNPPTIDRRRMTRWRSIGTDLIAGVIGFAVSFAIFLAAGAVIFPGLNWVGTYLSWNSRLDYSSFISDPTIWTTDVALLVPVTALGFAVLALIATHASRWSVLATVIAGANIAFTLGYLALVPGPWLEAPHYVAKLWPGALAATGLAFAAIIQARRVAPVAYAVLIAGVPLVLWSGHWSEQISRVQGLLIAAAMLLAFIGAAWAARRGTDVVRGIVVIAALIGIAVGSQILQNGRGLIGIYGQYPFRAAYVDFSAQTLMQSKIDAEEWVIGHTTRADTVGIWTDPDRAMSSSAAMQLWGKYNNVSGSATLSREEADALEVTRPSAIAMYAPTRDQIDTFWRSLPPWALPTLPECTSVVSLGFGVPRGQVCVTHLTWVG